MSVFSFPPTLGGVKLFVRALLADYGEAGLMADGPGVEALCLHETQVTARLYRCFWDTEPVGLTAGQATVTLARIFEINSAQVKDAGGRLLPCLAMTEAQLDRRDDRRFADAVTMIKRWRELPASDAPQTFIIRDGTTVQLVPAPSTTRTPGLFFRGWATPDLAWATAGDTASFPYDVKFAPVVGYRVAIRLMERAGGDASRLGSGLGDLLASLGVRVQSAEPLGTVPTMAGGRA